MDRGKEQLELWGGIECTINRVQDLYLDQLGLSGHYGRLSDFDLLAEIGIKVIRYPVLWEKVSPTPDAEDWSWADQSLGRLRDLGIEPVVGLVHHGSGPAHTSLLDPKFPEMLAEFARKVAERYSWVRMFTPINEPLTTARFSGLYGHWYPHGRDVATFATCLSTEIKATIEAMRAIRSVNPDAMLVQTEDLGKTHSTELLQYQANFENERRWLALDLLCGRVNPRSPGIKHLSKGGMSRGELDWFEENACPPNLLGINYYVTSERYLDENLSLYPKWTHGGNRRHRYADVEAVRVEHLGITGVGARLREAWDRYRLPLAVTESHLSCTREEQIRWVNEAWEAAGTLRNEGVDVRALTVWSLFGAFDWNSLLTRSDGFYEPGAFDLRSGEPRKTALTSFMKELAQHGKSSRDILQVPGWWRRQIRVEYPQKIGEDSLERYEKPDSRRLLITGATGTLGKAFARICELRGLPYILASRQDMEISNPQSVSSFLSEAKPWAVVNTAGYVRVDDAEEDWETCHRDNTLGAAALAECCADAGVPLVTFSSDLVFDGRSSSPYIESDNPSPLNHYGRSKAAAEKLVMDIHPDSLVVRTSAFFGPWDQYNFVRAVLETLARGDVFRAAADQVVSPTYVPDLVNATLDLLIDGEFGLRHLANAGEVDWAELARMVADHAGLDSRLVHGLTTEEFRLPARRPAYTALGTEKGQIMPTLQEGLNSYFRQAEGVGCLERSSKRARKAYAG
ncbi:MAG TPA: family 1 glycosylhydrolase [Fimbriimonadaceae bacterium]|nr:family 1 glycosylhydrolase [Fimbriimonadaceae bacterium]